MKIFFGEKYKNQYKSIQSGTLGQDITNWDWPGKIETVEMFAKTSNNKHDWDLVSECFSSQ